MACDIATLQQTACENGYRGLSDRKLREVLLVLLCNAGGSTGGGLGGTQALGLGVETGSVVFATPLAAVPTAIVLTVQSPTGGFIMQANLIAAPLATGFDFQLSGITDTATYVLHYVVIPA